MEPIPRRCEPDRLGLLLDDQLTEEEQSALSEHLEQCDDCRRALERLAARSRDWGDVQLLREASGGGDGTTVGEGPTTEADSESDEVVRRLDPPGRPDSLGRLGPYEVLEVIGRGGMGVVLKAHEPALDRIVAIKVLASALAAGPTARRRFAREARAAAAVTHEHIVAIYAVDEFRSLPYLVMQYVPGRSLQQRLDASGPPAIVEVARIGMQAASALAAAHEQGLVHRDVKPGNILLENCVERVRLTDFGLARAADDASLTQSGVIAGTPQYMAPEQARGEPIDARADLHALGAVLYAMCAGRPPFRAESTMAVLRRVCEDRPRPIREINADVPDWLATLIDRLMAKNPADRPADAAEVVALLAAGLAHLQDPETHRRPEITCVHPPSNPIRPVPASKRRRRPRLVLATGLFGALVLGLAATEAAGLTQVADAVATVLRIAGPEGTLVVEVDDPEVKVRIDGEELVITGTGPQEVRLRPGRHRFEALKDGEPVRRELVTISRGGRQVVAVSLEERPDPDTRPQIVGPRLVRTMPGTPGRSWRWPSRQTVRRSFQGAAGPGETGRSGSGT